MLTERHQFERRYKTKPTTKQYIYIYWSIKIPRKKTTTPNDNPQFNRENGRSDERNFTFEKVTNAKKNCIEREKIEWVEEKKNVFTHVYKNITDKTTCQLRRNRLANSNDSQPQRDRLKPATEEKKTHTNSHVGNEIEEDEQAVERKKNYRIYMIRNVRP